MTTEAPVAFYAERELITPRPGYDRHHVVEQHGARADGFPESMIDAPDNLVLIPRIRHYQINGWYSRKNPHFGGLTPRAYLQGKGWAERQRVGLDILRDYEVLE